MSENNISHMPLFRSKMAQEGLPPLLIDTFEQYYNQLSAGTTGFISEHDIVPLKKSDVPSALECDRYRGDGENALQHTVIIKLNGGLGTTMGLDSPKSLITVTGGFNFIDIAVKNAQKAGEKGECSVPVVFMNSFNTHEQTMAYLKKTGISQSTIPQSFIQHKFPKILKKTLAPAVWPANPRLEWNPPGHGNIYTAMVTSGLLDCLLKNGYRYAFVANIDNLGAAIDPGLLGYFASRDVSFMMEVVERTSMDRKGGHLARHQNGRLVLRELAQTAPQDLDMFQDEKRYTFFNTNNIWLNLPRLNDTLKKTGCVPDLPIIANGKNLDPRDSSSPDVYQIETAMGAAIGIFDDSIAVLAPRIRFSPVKRCEELLVAWSDYYKLNKDFSFSFNPERTLGSIEISLNPQHFRTIDDMRRCFPHGAPSLVRCSRLSVTGDVIFGAGVSLRGDVHIMNTSATPAIISDNTVIEGEMLIR